MVAYTESPLLATLRYQVPGPSPEMRMAILDQLDFGMREVYTHLPQKMSAFGIDPIAQLRALRATQDQNFTRRLLRIISGLKDRHTTLRLPPPWSSLIAYVPFVIERVYDNDRPLYIVTNQLFGFDEIPVGATVTHWNGTPIHLHVNGLAREAQGANWPACIRLALGNATIRPLAYVLMPEEDWVTLSFIDPDGTARTVSTPWRFYSTVAGGRQGGMRSGSVETTELTLGLDEQTLMSNEFRSAAKKEAWPSRDALTTDGVLRYGVIHTPSGRCGYLRLFSFEVPNPNAFLQQVAGILSHLPPERLIIDVRGNPGGQIPAGQGLIRMLTSKPLVPAPIAFRATRTIAALAEAPMFAQWQRSLRLQTATSNVWAQSFPIVEYYDNVPDYRYPGRVAVIVDALCYSTTDFFAADFVDNEVGPVIGTDANTGAGGANVWPWSVLVNFARNQGCAGPQTLPAGYDLNISMRRAYRTGANAGLPIEDLGVSANFTHNLTRRDLLEGNADLLAFTASKIA